MGNAQAGWYDDGAGKKRWWDGDKWTDDVQPQADPGGGLAGTVPKIEAHAVTGAQPRPSAQGASYVVLQVILKE